MTEKLKIISPFENNFRLIIENEYQEFDIDIVI